MLIGPIIFAVIGRKQIAERGDKGSGLAIAGLVLGIVGVVLSLFLLLTAQISSAGFDSRPAFAG